LAAATCHALRRAEQEYLHDGALGAIDRAEQSLRGCADDVVEATRWWLSLLRDLDGSDAMDRCLAAVDSLPNDTPPWRQVLAAVLVRRCARDGDLADLDRAILLMRTMPSTGAPTERNPLWLSAGFQGLELGTALLERFRLLGGDEDLAEAVDVLERARTAARMPVVRTLCLARLAACDQENYLLTGRQTLLSRAQRRYRRALAELGDGAPARPLLLTELGTVYQDRFAEFGEPADLETALRLGQAAVAAELSSGADLACHLVNLGNVWDAAYEQNPDDPRYLQQAIDCWRRALEHLPAGSPYRPAFLDRLSRGLTTRAQSRVGGAPEAEKDIDEAIQLARAAVAAGSASPSIAVFANQLAETLSLRWATLARARDLHEAVQVLEGAVASSSPQSVAGPDLIANLVQLRTVRYAAFGDHTDLDQALADLDRLPGVPLSPGLQSSIAAARAHLELMRYACDGQRADLTVAIGHARRALAHTPFHSVGHAPRAGYLAIGLFHRYQLTGRKRDLDAAIAALASYEDTADDLATNNRDLLTTFLQARYEQYGDHSDGRAAARMAGMAPGAPDGGGFARTENLALVLHDRFQLAGRLSDLDEVVQRHRRALAATHEGSPARVVILNNLGIALQDRFVYRGDDGDLEEAIAVHERALSCSPPRSPERAGLLHSLAAAMHTRIQNITEASDVERAVSLDEQALAALPPRSPERAVFLANLAAAYGVRARRTGRREHNDQAVATFRAALARVPAGRPARGEILYGYADALAERYIRFGRPQDLRQANAAHRRSLAETEANPVLLLDIAIRCGAWAAGRGQWADAAEAYGAAGAAQRRLFGAQADPADSGSWLNRGEGVASAGALALLRCGQATEAVLALEAGRALQLNQSLDLRTTADRLNRAGRSDLGSRLEEILARMADLRLRRSESVILLGEHTSG
jgi:hypothetical protein